MFQFSRFVVGLALLATLAFALPSSAEDDKDPSIKEIMTKAHKGGDAILGKIGKDLAAKEPDWADVTKLSKELVGLGASLAKNKPTKGEQESWDKLTKSYNESAKALLAAAEKKETKDAKEAHKKLSGSCKGCHDAHKGK
ncbi:MAG: cytochrome c [Gemmataceae bacterium]|nr:cytochrome c [Gemmataceae bacterium]